VQKGPYCARELLLCKGPSAMKEIHYCSRDPLLCKRSFTVHESCYCARELLLLKRDITVQESLDSFVYLLNSSISFHSFIYSEMELESFSLA